MGPARELARRAANVVANVTSAAVADDDVTTQASADGGGGSAWSKGDKTKQMIEEKAAQLAKKIPGRWRCQSYTTISQSFKLFVELDCEIVQV